MPYTLFYSTKEGQGDMIKSDGVFLLLPAEKLDDDPEFYGIVLNIDDQIRRIHIPTLGTIFRDQLTNHRREINHGNRSWVF